MRCISNSAIGMPVVFKSHSVWTQKKSQSTDTVYRVATTKDNSSELDILSDAVAMIEEYLRRIRLRGKYPLQTELDLIGIAFEVGQIKSILRDEKVLEYQLRRIAITQSPT